MPEWRMIDGFPNYSVSSEGDIVNTRFGREVSPREGRDGALRVALYNNGVRSDLYVHRLVAQAFLHDYDDERHVKHKDGNLQNNSIINLRMSRTGATRLLPQKLNRIRGRRVLIVETGQTFKNAYSCAEFLDTHPSNIYAVLRGDRDTHLGYSFTYIERDVLISMEE